MTDPLRTAAANLSDLALHLGDERLHETAIAVRESLVLPPVAVRLTDEEVTNLFNAYMGSCFKTFARAEEAAVWAANGLREPT